jgi:uncharacterized protein YcfJ
MRRVQPANGGQQERSKSMRSFATRIVAAAGVLLLGSNAGWAMSPSVQVVPAPNKPFDVFQQDDAVCRQYAEGQVGPQDSGSTVVGSAIVGTLLGAGLGAAVGGGRGAAIGAGAGAAAGTGYGANAAAQQQYSAQQRYDNAYVQCMYSKGNQVPGYQGGAAPPPPGSQPPAPGSQPPPDTQGQPPGYPPPPSQ